MTRLKKFQPELVTPLFLEARFRHNPAAINKGNCMQWAYMAYRMFEGVQLWDICSHAFIKVQGKFYDSERLEGESDWKDLPACNFGAGCGSHFCERSGKPAQRRNPNNFKRQWNKTRVRPDWSGYRWLVQSFVEKRIGHEAVVNQETCG